MTSHVSRDVYAAFTNSHITNTNNGTTLTATARASAHCASTPDFSSAADTLGTRGTKQVIWVVGDEHDGLEALVGSLSKWGHGMQEYRIFTDLDEIPWKDALPSAVLLCFSLHDTNSLSRLSELWVPAVRGVDPAVDFVLAGIDDGQAVDNDYVLKAQVETSRTIHAYSFHHCRTNDRVDIGDLFVTLLAVASSRNPLEFRSWNTSTTDVSSVNATKNPKQPRGKTHTRTGSNGDSAWQIRTYVGSGGIDLLIQQEHPLPQVSSNILRRRTVDSVRLEIPGSQNGTPYLGVNSSRKGFLASMHAVMRSRSPHLVCTSEASSINVSNTSSTSIIAASTILAPLADSGNPGSLDSRPPRHYSDPSVSTPDSFRPIMTRSATASDLKSLSAPAGDARVSGVVEYVGSTGTVRKALSRRASTPLPQALEIDVQTDTTSDEKTPLETPSVSPFPPTPPPARRLTAPVFTDDWKKANVSQTSLCFPAQNLQGRAMGFEAWHTTVAGTDRPFDPYHVEFPDYKVPERKFSFQGGIGKVKAHLRPKYSRSKSDTNVSLSSSPSHPHRRASSPSPLEDQSAHSHRHLSWKRAIGMRRHSSGPSLLSKGVETAHEQEMSYRHEITNSHGGKGGGSMGGAEGGFVGAHSESQPSPNGGMLWVFGRGGHGSHTSVVSTQATILEQPPTPVAENSSNNEPPQIMVPVAASSVAPSAGMDKAKRRKSFGTVFSKAGGREGGSFRRSSAVTNGNEEKEKVNVSGFGMAKRLGSMIKRKQSV